jgi:hypothetical protein
MSDATTSCTKSPELVKVAERAKRNPDQRILALAHLIDEPALERAFRSLRRDAAVGVRISRRAARSSDMRTTVRHDGAERRSQGRMDAALLHER